MRIPCGGTRTRAKKLSRLEIEPFRRVVREAESDESFVVLVVVHVRVVDAPLVRLFERPPVLGLDRLPEGCEAQPDERRDVVAVLRSRRGRGLEDLLRLLCLVGGEIPVAGLRGVVEDPVPPAQLVHQAGHAGLHRRDLVDGQGAVLRRRPHARPGDRGLVHRRGNGNPAHGRFGEPAFAFSTAYSTIASAALIPVASRSPLKPGDALTSSTYGVSPRNIMSTPLISSPTAFDAFTATCFAWSSSSIAMPFAPRWMFARHSLCAATRFIDPTTRSPTTSARMSTPGFGMYSWRHITSPRIFRTAGYRTSCAASIKFGREARRMLRGIGMSACRSDWSARNLFRAVMRPSVVSVVRMPISSS